VIATVDPLPRTAPVESGYVAIVDDEESVCRALARLLRAYSFQVRTYQSAREFLASLNNSVPACLIVDLHMPYMTGLELLHHLADRGLGIPAIVVTARDVSDMQRRRELPGSVAFLLKPVMLDPLLKAIEIAIGMRAFADARAHR
jgi:FixJ family two-component response regulator